jgi:cytochrome b6-f complex iron-sulfur subunit
VQASGRSFLVARTGAETFSALTATCTHEACTVTGFQSPNYVCPCHGSRYSLTGVVLNGPAPFSLAQFQTGFEDDTLTIRV